MTAPPETNFDADRVSEYGGRLDSASRWMYRGIWSALVSLFRVPDRPPSMPTGADEFADTFQPADGFLRYLKFWFWVVSILIDLLILGGWIALAVNEWVWALILLPLTVVIMFVPDVIAYIGVHLRYDTTWYVMTDRALRIRRGIWTIQETSITFENVQNVKVTQGPVQRHFGIATVVIDTAGAGSGSSSHGSVANQGIIEGLANAAEIRDRILARTRQSVSAGLGDERDETDSARRGSRAATDRMWTAEHLALLRVIRDQLVTRRA